MERKIDNIMTEMSKSQYQLLNARIVLLMLLVYIIFAEDRRYYMECFFNQVIQHEISDNTYDSKSSNAFKYIFKPFAKCFCISSKYKKHLLFDRITYPGISMCNSLADYNMHCYRCDSKMVVKEYKKFNIKSKDVQSYKAKYPDLHYAIYTCPTCKKSTERKSHNLSTVQLYGVAYRGKSLKDPVFLFPCQNSPYLYVTWRKFLKEYLEYELSDNPEKSKYSFARNCKTEITENTAIKWIDITSDAVYDLYTTINDGICKCKSQEDFYYDNNIRRKVFQLYNDVDNPKNQQRILRSLLYLIYAKTYFNPCSLQDDKLFEADIKRIGVDSFKNRTLNILEWFDANYGDNIHHKALQLYNEVNNPKSQQRILHSLLYLIYEKNGLDPYSLQSDKVFELYIKKTGVDSFRSQILSVLDRFDAIK